MCRFCDDDGIEILNNREPSENGNEANTGFEVYIFKKKLKVFACLDKPNIKPVCSRVSVDIKYCPMCGRNLQEKPEKEDLDRMTASENRAYWGTFG